MAGPASKGAVKSATRHFRRQRTTALALIPLSFILIATVIALAGADYETARAHLANPVVAALVLIILLPALVHMRIGMDDIIDDYVQGRFLNVLSKLANALFCAAVALGSLTAAAKILIGF